VTMKIDTPQILWHNGSDGNGKPAPLYSVSVLPSFCDENFKSGDGSAVAPAEVMTEVLATAGNTNEINLWKVSSSSGMMQNNFSKKKTLQSSNNSTHTKILHSSKNPAIVHHLTLSRHERSINSLSFSPKGTHLATAGDGGSLLFYSVPYAHRYNNGHRNTHTFWSSILQQEKDLMYKIVPTHTEDVMDVSWGSDERRLVVGTLDHSVLVFEETSTRSASTAIASMNEVGQTQWTCVYRNDREHTQYVQGVSFDPQGAYFASQGSDRTVRVWTRKKSCVGGNKSSNKKVLTAIDKNVPPQVDSTLDMSWLDKKFEVTPKAKMLKYCNEQNRTRERDREGTVGESMDKSHKKVHTSSQKKYHMFADESTVKSFFRRLAWTADGAFLITPAAIWQDAPECNTSVSNAAPNASTSFAALLFARHHFDRPFKVLSGLTKPAVVIRANPVLYELPPEARDNSKENLHTLSPSSTSTTAKNQNKGSDSLIPYRSIFAVLTLDTILIYDTYHTHPLCIASGLHCTGLTDCTWSSNGRNLVVSSTDGYITIMSFEEGELGDVYTKPKFDTDMVIGSFPPNATSVFQDKRNKQNNLVLPSKPKAPSLSSLTNQILPCAPGQNAKLVAPPTKKARTLSSNTEEERKKKKILIASNIVNPPLVEIIEESCQNRGTKREVDITAASNELTEKVVNAAEEIEVLGGVTKLSLHNNLPRKKKRIQPTLLCGK